MDGQAVGGRGVAGGGGRGGDDAPEVGASALEAGRCGRGSTSRSPEALVEVGASQRRGDAGSHAGQPAARRRRRDRRCRRGRAPRPRTGRCRAPPTGRARAPSRAPGRPVRRRRRCPPRARAAGRCSRAAGRPRRGPPCGRRHLLDVEVRDADPPQRQQQARGDTDADPHLDPEQQGREEGDRERDPVGALDLPGVQRRAAVDELGDGDEHHRGEDDLRQGGEQRRQQDQASRRRRR
jgi:hypothetical protein